MTTFNIKGFGDCTVKSVGGVGTLIYARWGKTSDDAIIVDLGQLPDDPKGFAVNNLFITHTHMDHIQQLLTFLSMRERIAGLKDGAIIHVPVDSVDKITQMIDSFYELDDSVSPHTIVGLSPRDSLTSDESKQQVLLNNSKLRVTPFQTDHRVPSMGLRIQKFERQIKPEYINCDPSQKKSLAMTGQLYNYLWIDKMVITGDTTIDPLLNPSYRWIYDAQYVLTEITMLDDSLPIDEVVKRGHIHVSQLAAIQEKFKGQIVGYHFSARYKNTEIEQLIAQYFDADQIILAHALH